MVDPIITALVAACPATIVSGITLAVNRNQNKTIGKKNGKGTLVSMVESLVEWKGAHTAEHKWRDAHTTEHEEIATEEAAYRKATSADN